MIIDVVASILWLFLYSVTIFFAFLVIISFMAFVDQELFDGAIFRTLDNVFEWLIKKIAGRK